MKISDAFKNMEAIKLTAMFVTYMLMAFDNAIVFAIGSGVVLVFCAWYLFRSGAAMGREACAASDQMADMAGDPARAGEIQALAGRTYAPARGLAGLCAGGLVGYVINCAYIIAMALGVQGVVLFGLRFMAVSAILPWWGILSVWHESFTVLTWDIVLALMLSPFALPAVWYAGYLQGPKLWKRSVEAMKAGKRRAKARSRIGRQLRGQSRQKKPEI